MTAIPIPQYGPAPSPTSGQWQAAHLGDGSGPVYWARLLIGPADGGLMPAQGAYRMFVKVTNSPEIPVLAGWQLLVVA